METLEIIGIVAIAIPVLIIYIAVIVGIIQLIIEWFRDNFIP